MACVMAGEGERAVSEDGGISAAKERGEAAEAGGTQEELAVGHVQAAAGE